MYRKLKVLGALVNLDNQVGNLESSRNDFAFWLSIVASEISEDIMGRLQLKSIDPNQKLVIA